MSDSDSGKLINQEVTKGLTAIIKSWFSASTQPLKVWHRIGCAFLGSEVFLVSMMLLHPGPIRAMPFEGAKLIAAIVAVFIVLSLVCFMVSCLLGFSDRRGKHVRLFLEGIALHIVVIWLLSKGSVAVKGLLDTVER